MFDQSSSFKILQDEFVLFSKYLEDNCGILLADHKQYLVQSRLNKIMQECAYTNLKELIGQLKRPGQSRLKEQVIDAMTTNETLWFRDTHPYDILKRQLLPEMRDKKRAQRLRIWSAACSTGQEPYSMSMIIDEFKQANPGSFSAGEEILATDISTNVLQQARSGEYEMLALGRGLDKERLQRHFKATERGSWVINPGIKSRVRFQSFNLLDQYGTLGQFDIIFCRNVLIYFSSELKTQILRKMHKQLAPGGYLVLGASESLSGLSDCYTMIHCRPGIIYQAI
ncbi:protein-glutamate O-methyltransferase CheR [Neptunomonas phycophila]|uniref:Chemotaxis protein methyltransferase n=1 Tax=Neptunomonas phycophila TaxID=1572645 RepID=A0AAW7XQG5_9GAMM|nr:MULTISPECIES: protein-glutamate O-methyltransferase CheR [Neptunomonas]MDN2660540.1 protein-glutamate O-methyltransferase CheR [Neptunomonas sp. CHC150]MDO6455272.1 protein-glutamate O-methyltransferase CheR [Neptunomonas phycophila]MDO6469735.1 protein-glutamate O-methyltransferase CheR [Neptunomonas phycophila]MDP2524123.1 protein-glutamate O-methyltransferase CheR [Neptunomonas phycophila]